jgi:hypothetical protein
MPALSIGSPTDTTVQYLSAAARLALGEMALAPGRISTDPGHAHAIPADISNAAPRSQRHTGERSAAVQSDGEPACLTSGSKGVGASTVHTICRGVPVPERIAAFFGIPGSVNKMEMRLRLGRMALRRAGAEQDRLLQSVNRGFMLSKTLRELLLYRGGVVSSSFVTDLSLCMPSREALASLRGRRVGRHMMGSEG